MIAFRPECRAGPSMEWTCRFGRGRTQRVSWPVPAHSPRSRNGSATSPRGPAGISASPPRPALRHRVRPAPPHHAPPARPTRRRRPGPGDRRLPRRPRHPGRPRLRAIAVDGKALRGSRTPVTGHVTLLAAMDHTGHVLTQCQVAHKSDEISAFQPLLDNVDLTGTIITADALHTQHAHVTYLRERGARYIAQVKANHPGLFHRIRRLPWREITLDHYDRTRAHHRLETGG
ncbi:ISAs1 family transposase [Streptomyces sp. NPDC085937]|uniref:ISAs1 family transposase n=1 Tax=Streptomyces sp. NPDC085937 TaxID=3365742 RepID=UPI0037D2BA67